MAAVHAGDNDEGRSIRRQHQRLFVGYDRGRDAIIGPRERADTIKFSASDCRMLPRPQKQFCTVVQIRIVTER
jgi:hypothetical protein